jgi:putative ATPase
LGKRGTDTRPRASSNGARTSSPEIVVVDDQEPAKEPSAKRAKVESKHFIVVTHVYPPTKTEADVAPIFAKPLSTQAGAQDEALISSAPLAERLRPRMLSDFVGQEHLVGDGSLLLSLVESRSIGSMILWGPPG